MGMSKAVSGKAHGALAGLALGLASLGLAVAARRRTTTRTMSSSLSRSSTTRLDNLGQQEYKAAAKGFEEVDRQHPYSVWATKAEIMAASPTTSRTSTTRRFIALDRFISFIRAQGHPLRYYLKALCYYEQISDIGRDQRITQQALDALAEVVKRFPESPYARDARLKVELAIDHSPARRCGRRYYQQNQQYIGAINRYRVVIERYQTTTHVPEALHRLVESYLSLGVKSEAQEAAAVLGYNFPGSDWYQDSYYLMTAKAPLRRSTRSAGSSPLLTGPACSSPLDP